MAAENSVTDPTTELENKGKGKAVASEEPVEQSEAMDEDDDSSEEEEANEVLTSQSSPSVFARKLTLKKTDR